MTTSVQHDRPTLERLGVVRRAVGRVPAPLAALLVVTALFGVAWALVVPAWQAPDENAHFAYAQSLAERFELPGHPVRQQQSTEQLVGADASEADQLAANRPGRPPWSEAAEQRWEERRFTAEQRADGGGVNPAASNPPLYYLFAAGAYRVAGGGDVFARLYAERIAGVLWLLLTVTASWLLAGEVLGRRRPLQLLAAAVTGLVPMVTFVSASVSPDGMLYALWALALWLGVRILRHGITTPSAAAFFGVVAAAILVKASSYALVPAALVVLAVALWRRVNAGDRRGAVLPAAAGTAALVVPVFVWWLVARGAERGVAEQVTTVNTDFGLTKLRQFLSYLWQFYLPSLPFQDSLPAAAGNTGFQESWVRGGFGRFGWLEVTLPGWVYGIALAVLLAIAIGLIVLALRRWRDIDVPIALFFVVAGGALLAGLHWTDFNFILSGSSFIQGRYLLPLSALAGLLTALAVTSLPARWRPTAAGLLVGGLVLAQLVSLATTMTRFYA